MNKQEGRIRIPSGCAISAVISRDGKRMTGEKIIESMQPHARPLQRAGRRLCGLRHLPGVQGLFRPAYVSGGSSRPKKLRGFFAGDHGDRPHGAHPHPHDAGHHQ